LCRYGLLLADDIETFLLQLFTAAAHANTRGSWTAPEETDIGGGAMPYASSSQMLMPINLRWMLLWEHPLTNRTLWLARAVPRSWLSEGNNVSIASAPTSFGRVTYTIVSAIESRGCVVATVFVDNSHVAEGSSSNNNSSSDGSKGWGRIGRAVSALPTCLAWPPSLSLLRTQQHLLLQHMPIGKL
jgi:hypothetical protein